MKKKKIIPTTKNIVQTIKELNRKLDNAKKPKDIPSYFFTPYGAIRFKNNKAMGLPKAIQWAKERFKK